MTRLPEAPSWPQAVREATGSEWTRKADGSLFGSDGGGSCCAQGHGMRNSVLARKPAPSGHGNWIRVAAVELGEP